MLGAAQTLQESSAEAARELLGGPPATTRRRRRPRRAGRAARPRSRPRASSWMPPRRAGGRRSAGTATCAGSWTSDGSRTCSWTSSCAGPPTPSARSTTARWWARAAQAQVAAVTLAIVAAKAAGSRAFARRATIRGAANALRLTRPGSAAMAAALDRMLALLDEAGLETPGDEVAAALHAEAERIIGEATDDHGALVGHLISALPGGADEPPARARGRQHGRDGRRPVRDGAVRGPDGPPRGPPDPCARAGGPPRPRGLARGRLGAAPGGRARTRS